MSMIFTATSLRNLKKFDKATFISGFGADRGINIRVMPSGTITWYLFYSFEGKINKMKIGKYPTYGIDEIRDLCKGYRQQIDQGVNPMNIRKNAKIQQLGTCTDMLNCYYQYLEHKGTKTLKTIKKAVSKDIGHIADIRVKDVTISDIVYILQNIMNRGALVMAERYKSYLHAAFEFSINYESVIIPNKRNINFQITINPVSLLANKYNIDKKRSISTRFLNFNEIHHLVNTTYIPNEFILRIKLLLSTGQRIRPIMCAPMTEIDLLNKIWSWPASRMKINEPHAIPLTDMHIELITESYALCGSKGKYLYPKYNKPEINEPSNEKALAKYIRQYCEKTNTEKFVLKDLRRTFKTLGSKIGISKDDLDKVQHHRTYDVSNIVYNQNDYYKEKQEALEKWCNKLETVFKTL